MFNLCFPTDKLRSLNLFHSGLFELCEHVLSLTVVINDAPSSEGVAHHKLTCRKESAHFGLQFRCRNYLLFMVSTGNYPFFIWTDVFLVQIAWTVQNFVHEQKQFHVDGKAVWTSEMHLILSRSNWCCCFFYSEDKCSLSQLKPESLFRAS